MKPSSSDVPAPRLPADALTEGPAVVPARLDRQLAAGVVGAGWAHPQIEEQIARARASAAAAARSEGYAAGWAEGRRAAADAAAEETHRLREQAAAQADRDATRVEHALGVLAEALHRVDEAAVPAWDEVAAAVVDGAVGIARAVLARELGSLDATTLEALHTAVRCLGHPPEVTVEAHPDDVALLDAVAPARRPAALQLVPDPTQTPGRLVARTVTQRVAVGIPAALAAAEEVFRA